MGGTECQSLSVRRASCCYQFTHRTNREQRPTAESALPHPDPSNMIRQLDLHASTWLAHVSSISQLLHRPQPYKACLPRPPTPSVHSIIYHSSHRCKQLQLATADHSFIHQCATLQSFGHSKPVTPSTVRSTE